MKQLAIIIPAYKREFLGKALESIALQSCQDFTVYIGDDNSPQNVFSVVERFKNKVDLVYHRFDSNMGGHDLVGQWERCIALSQGEPWIWLFSDDDEMEPECVERFYSEIETGKNYDLYHFNVDIIDENGGLFARRQPFPEWLSSKAFIVEKLKGNIASYVVEYIFSRKCYEKCGGFQKFDLAWGSDDATWIKFGLKKGIKTIEGAKVKWRHSGLNISPNNKDKSLIKRKIQSNLYFINWLNVIFDEQKQLSLSLKISEMTWFCTNLIKYRKSLRNSEVLCCIKSLCYALNSFAITLLAYPYYFLKRLLTFQS